MNIIEFFKNEIYKKKKEKKRKKNCFSYGLNNVMTCKRFLFFRGGASQEDILGLAISLIFDQFSIL